MKTLIIAAEQNIDDLVALRVEMQIEDWTNTLNEDFSCYAEPFANITRKHVQAKLNRSLYFALMYLNGEPIAMCGIEELSELPQITVCTECKGRHGCVVSVYTKPQHRGNGYQQELIQYLLDFAKKEHFNNITLTTNTPDAMHIYEKMGFQWISNKYFLAL